MPDIGPAGAISLARAAVEVGAEVGARAWRVGRLDRPVEAYYMVIVGEDRAAVMVAAVDASSGEIRETARLAGSGPHLTVDAANAILLAGAPGDIQPVLVWKPCRASRSPLYPLWQLPTPQGMTYVDQQGRVWRELDLGGPGG